MKTITVLFTVLVAVAMIAAAGGIRDAVDAELTAEVEALLEGSPLREYAGLERTPIPPIPPAPLPVPIGAATAISMPTGIPEAAPYRGAALAGLVFVEDGYAPLTDLDALYGVSGPPAVQPARVQPPTDLVDDIPALFVSALANPPLDAK